MIEKKGFTNGDVRKGFTGGTPVLRGMGILPMKFFSESMSRMTFLFLFKE